MINFFGERAEFDHIGVAVNAIDPALLCVKTEDPVQRVRVAFITVNGLPVELIEPAEPSSPVSGMLARGATMYHVCFRVPELAVALETASRQGFRIVAEPVKAAAFNNRKIAWVFSPVYGLFELVESEGVPGNKT
jgi:methylmalonyl-CoA/ethylmalonyl-CoA epimerase